MCQPLFGACCTIFDKDTPRRLLMTLAMDELNHQNVEVVDPFDAFTTTRRFNGLVPTSDDLLDVTSLGKGLVVESERKVDFTRELATRLLEMPELPGERALRNKHVTTLIAHMKRGTFLPERVDLITCLCDENGIDHRINGQHCCWAILEMPEDYECPGKVSLVKYRAKTMEDMRRLYASIDRNAPRTKSHVVNAHLAGTEQFRDLPPSLISLVAEGYAFHRWAQKHERTKRDGDDVAFMMQGEDAQLVNTVVNYLNTFSITSIPWMRRAPVVGGMFTTFSKAVKDSAQFWDSVRDGTGFDQKHDPRLKLRNSLMTCKVSSVGGNQRGDRGAKSVSSEEIIRWIIHAWNAWRKNEPLTVLRAMLKADRPKAK